MYFVPKAVPMPGNPSAAMTFSIAVNRAQCQSHLRLASLPQGPVLMSEVCFGTVEVLGGLLPPFFELPDSTEFFDLGV